jgi:DHA2 family multidrug resistance protein
VAETQPANGIKSDDEYREYSTATRVIILVALMCGVLLEILDVSIVNVAIPDMMGNLGATLDQISWVSTGYIIANVIVLPLTGWLSSHFGRRRYLGYSMIIFTVASFFCGISRSLNMLIFFRILQGIGGAALLSTAQATMLEIFPPWQIGMVQGIFGIGIMVGPTVGPTLGGWITDNYTWPWIFFINIPIGIIAATLTLMFLRDSRHQTRHASVDFIGIILLAVGIGSLQTILEKGNREDWFQSNLICILSVVMVIGLIAFVWWELHTPHPAVNLRILKNSAFSAGTCFAMVLGFGLYGGTFVLPVFMQSLLHYSAAQTGWMLFPGGIATALVIPWIGKLVYKTKPRNLVAIGTVGFIISMLLLKRLNMDSGQMNIFWPLVLRGASMGFLFMPLNLSTLLVLEQREIPAGTGMFNLFRQLGGSMGIAFLATFVDHREAFHRSMLVERVNVYSTAALQRLHALEGGFMARGFSHAVASKQALATVDRIVQGQSAVLAYDDALLMIAYVFIGVLPLVLLLRNTMLSQRPGATPMVD